MTTYTGPVDDMMFLLRDVFKEEDTWQRLTPSLEMTYDLAETILHELARIASEVAHPANAVGDREGCRFEGGDVTAPASFRTPYDALAQGGWIGFAANQDFGGQGMPKTLASFVEEMQWGSSCALRLYSAATAGAVLLLEDHAPEELKRLYLEKMNAGIWTGTMAMTEPQCGTDLGLMTTAALPDGNGAFELTGNKIFLSGGDHDLSENIIHLVLAKLPDAPRGSGGVSLFLVPKFLVKEDGSIGERNGVFCDGIEDKMGIKGSATCSMRFEIARAWLIGEPHRGLKSMFTMMNYERINVGLQGLGLAELAYQNAVAYARERRQGRRLSGAADPHDSADRIIVHPDVRRSLMTQRAFNEGGRAFAMYLGHQLDVARFSDNQEERNRALALADLLTPVMKAFATDRGFECCVEAQQLFGGHGYIKETGLEQIVRDARIAQIYEGANGVIALDLAGRKVQGTGGALVHRYLNEIDEAIGSTDINCPEMDEALISLKEARDVLIEVSNWLLRQPNLAFNNADEIGAASTEYLNLFGYVAYAHMWVLMMSAAQQAGPETDFARTKIATGRFFMQRVLPRIYGLAECIRAGASPVMRLDPAQF